MKNLTIASRIPGWVMFKPCSYCEHKNLRIAHFCAQCGRPFDEAGPPGNRSPAPRRKIGIGWLLLAVPVCLFFVTTRATWQVPFWRSNVLETRQYDLEPERASALYNLLSPRSVRVLVVREDGGMRVEGTRQELKILDRFVELLGRVGCQHKRCIQVHIENARPTWTTRRSYRLPRQQAVALYRILTAEEVPVGVSKRDSEVRVSANVEDQRTINHVVNILRGYRSP